MNEKMIDKYIQALSEKLGVAAKHIFEALYSQQIYYGLMELIVSLVLLVILVVSIKLTINIFAKAKYETKGEYYTIREPANLYAKVKESEFVEMGLIWLVFGIAWIILVIVILSMMPDGIMRLINPNYYAIKEILDSL